MGVKILGECNACFRQRSLVPWVSRSAAQPQSKASIRSLAGLELLFCRRVFRRLTWIAGPCAGSRSWGAENLRPRETANSDAPVFQATDLDCRVLFFGVPIIRVAYRAVPLMLKYLLEIVE
jgi:hypothetical protein